MIVDPDRSFEAACDVNEISLNNIWQARILTATGDLEYGNASEMDSVAARALSGAAWNVDPAKMTPELQAAWQQVEFGNYAPAASTLKRMARSRKPDVKAAAALLNDYVAEKLKAQLTEAETADGAGEAWKAYRVLSDIQQKFKGYDIPPNVDADVKRLEKSDDVSREIDAYRKLEGARKSAASRSATIRQRVPTMLQQLIEDYPGTTAAEEAQAILSMP